MDRLGVGWSVLSARNPRLVYASGTGYGLSGPDRDRLAMDLTIQAYGGAMSVTGFPDGPPVKAGPQVADFLGGVHLFAGVTSALYQRERTGRGAHIEIAMQEAQLMAMASNWGTLAATGEVGRTGNRHSGLAIAPYNVYATTDGAIALICTAEEHWFNLLRAMDRADLVEDPRYGTNADRAAHLDEVDAIVAAWTVTRTKADVFAAAQAHHVPAAPVRTLAEVAADPHLHEREALRPVDHPDLGPVTLPQSPLRFDGRPPAVLAPSPRFGAHNREVFGGLLGLDDAALEELTAAGVI
jgi:crotonobetainyl-CoA:carnitine CoA-transferase CaiB-like acyl-CoA transferase